MKPADALKSVFIGGVIGAIIAITSSHKKLIDRVSRLEMAPRTEMLYPLTSLPTWSITWTNRGDVWTLIKQTNNTPQ